MQNEWSPTDDVSLGDTADAEAEAVALLRRLADHIEAGHSPLFVSLKNRKQGFETEFVLRLMTPWGG